MTYFSCTKVAVARCLAPYQKEMEEDGRSRDGSEEEQARPTLKVESLSEPKGVRTLTNVAV